MKNISLVILSLFFYMTIYSQTINIENKDGTRIAGAYYKDVNSHLNQFEGTYRYINGNEELTIVFKKFTNLFNGEYYQDVLAGEIKFKKDGIVLFDNLSKINENLPNKYLHDICGNSIIKNTSRPVCPDCYENQKRARLIFFGRDNNDEGGAIILQKIIENGQPERMRIYILYTNRIKIHGEPEPLPAKIRDGEYILTRID